jgi:hypothetical protein
VWWCCEASPKWVRHSLCVVGIKNGLLYTLNMQAPSLRWADLEPSFRRIADSFVVFRV